MRLRNTINDDKAKWVTSLTLPDYVSEAILKHLSDSEYRFLGGILPWSPIINAGHWIKGKK